jgi:hypothetical protein
LITEPSKETGCCQGQSIVDERRAAAWGFEVNILRKCGCSQRMQQGTVPTCNKRLMGCSSRFSICSKIASFPLRGKLKIVLMFLVFLFLSNIPDEIRDQLRSLTRMQLVRICAAWRPDLLGYRDPVVATRIALQSLTRRILRINDEVGELDRLIEPLVSELVSNLLELEGVGTESAGQFIVTAGENPDRLRSEAGFAMLCGACPIPASSGKTQRHRLNRGGCHQANSALHMVVICRMRTDDRTKTYVARRIQEGRSKREIMRCLKHYIAREIYNVITAAPAS